MKKYQCQYIAEGSIEQVIDDIKEVLQSEDAAQINFNGRVAFARAVGREFSAQGYFTFLMFYEPYSRLQYLTVSKKRYEPSTGPMSWIQEL